MNCGVEATLLKPLFQHADLPLWFPLKNKMVHSMLDYMLPDNLQADYKDLECISNAAYVASLTDTFGQHGTCNLLFGELSTTMSDEHIIAHMGDALKFAVRMNLGTLRSMRAYLEHRRFEEQGTSSEAQSMLACFSKNVYQQMLRIRELKMKNASPDDVKAAIDYFNKLGGDDVVFYGPHIAHVLFGWSLENTRRIGCYKLTVLLTILQEYYLTTFFEQTITHKQGSHDGSISRIQFILARLQQSKTMDEKTHWLRKINELLTPYAECSTSLKLIHTFYQREINSHSFRRAML